MFLEIPYVTGMDTGNCQLVTDLLRVCHLCCRLVTGKSPTCYGLAKGKLV